MPASPPGSPILPHHTATVAPGRRVYAVGDIHGRLDLLNTLIESIREDAERAHAHAPIVVFLGDYIDRGPDSRGVIERLRTLDLAEGASYVLKGNHEAMLLDFLDGGPGESWLANGGAATARSYGIDVSGTAHTPQDLRRELRSRMGDEHIAFLRSLGLFHREGGYLFVHAGINPARTFAEQREADLIWIRAPFLEYDGDLGAVVVHGHTTADTPQICPHRIGIDTRAWASGVLTALVLQGGGRAFLQT